ncbi:MAE_28990/MAE_18760 family HEPN-like nuclease [Amycolatopsis mongoliensis]|uniref:MAE_28990/MAE_18760 family HEPN-like nuclease n=1 Tax=Amycolatopsis mongoliensis TaxID=715475 RepID=A0A9Y2JQH2_9PSEU|nr:MAE_28990/MAE_18760 family HEPN-like nuclease [Amycolatopsis sp. 4-36]WIY02810.1 MAE_28990/MAE_18760 family HEPN-like nuclease [Amycolatopsis sp. 4-36]
MGDRYIEEAWRASAERFDQLKLYVNASFETIPRGDVDYRVNLYSSWILLAYAATEAAFTKLGNASLQTLKVAAGVPGDLPPQLMAAHQKRTLAYLSAQATSERKDSNFQDAISHLDSVRWAEFSRLTAIDRNVWSDVIREWCDRLMVAEAKISWMKAPFGDSSESAASRLDKLVSERNSIAHGEVPENLLGADLMCGWIDDARSFFERCICAMQAHFVERFGTFDCRHLGEVDEKVTLGPSTVAIKKLDVAVSVGDHVCLVPVGDGAPRVGSIISIQSEGVSLQAVEIGRERVAIGLSRQVRANSLFEVL